MQFLCNFGTPWWLRISKTFNKEQIGCQEDFLRKLTKTQKIQTLKILCSFCVNLENLGGFEFQRRSKRNKLVVVGASVKR